MNWPLIFNNRVVYACCRDFFQYRTLGKLGRTYWKNKQSSDSK